MLTGIRCKNDQIHRVMCLFFESARQVRPYLYDIVVQVRCHIICLSVFAIVQCSTPVLYKEMLRLPGDLHVEDKSPHSDVLDRRMSGEF